MSEKAHSKPIAPEKSISPAQEQNDNNGHHSGEKAAPSASAKEKLSANLHKISEKISASPLGKVTKMLNGILGPQLHKAFQAGMAKNENRSAQETAKLIFRGLFRALYNLIFSLPQWILHGEPMTRISAIGFIISAFLLVRVSPRVPASVIALMQGKPSRALAVTSQPKVALNPKDHHHDEHAVSRQPASHQTHSGDHSASAAAVHDKTDVKEAALVHPVYLGHLSAPQGLWAEVFVECSDASSAQRLRELLPKAQESVVAELTNLQAEGHSTASTTFRAPAGEEPVEMNQRFNRAINEVLDKGRILRVIIAGHGQAST